MGAGTGTVARLIKGLNRSGKQLSDGTMAFVFPPSQSVPFDPTLSRQYQTMCDMVASSRRIDSSNDGSINWTAALSYNTSKGFGYFTHNRTFTTAASGQEHDETYQSEGGRVCVTAQTTLGDGSTVQDNVTFYVEGTQTFDPTSQLVTLYPNGATPRLMTGIAQHESTYYQFFSQNLLNATALWPHESFDGGSHIGLMMVPITEPFAWGWMQNTNDGVNSTDHGFVGAKLPLANTWANWITAGNSTKNIPAHQNLPPLTAVQLEDMALVLYGPASPSWTMQYYVPVCPSGVITVKHNTWTCSGASWYWAVNDPIVDKKVTAANTGVTTFGNHLGVLYVSNTILLTDLTVQPGVRAQLH